MLRGKRLAWQLLHRLRQSSSCYNASLRLQQQQQQQPTGLLLPAVLLQQQLLQVLLAWLRAAAWQLLAAMQAA